MLPPAFLGGEEQATETKAEGSTLESLPLVGGLAARGIGADLRGSCLAPGGFDGLTHSCPRLGMPLTRDPFGRDADSGGSSSSKRSKFSCRTGVSSAGWSVEPLAKYLKGVAERIDTNLREECVPSAERLEVFVSRLVSHTQKQLKNAPRKDRHTLEKLFSNRFQTFWDVTRNQKVRATTPEELKWALVSLVENLFSEFAVCPDALLLAQPKPVHYSCAQILRGGAEL